MMTLQSKMIALSLTTAAAALSSSPMALADIDIGTGYIASHTPPDDDDINPVGAGFCDEAGDYVSCDGTTSVTFTTTNQPNSASGSSSTFQRSEMRIYAGTVTNGDGSYSGSATGNNFVLDTFTGVASAYGGVDAIVTSTLSVDQVPSTFVENDDASESTLRYGVIFSQFHGESDEPMRAYAIATEAGSDEFYVAVRHEENGLEIDEKEEVQYNLDDFNIPFGATFDFDASIDGADLLITVTYNGVSQTEPIDISGSGYDTDYIYAKFGAYSSNNGSDENSIVTYYDYNIEYGAN